MARLPRHRPRRGPAPAGAGPAPAALRGLLQARHPQDRRRTGHRSPGDGLRRSRGRPRHAQGLRRAIATRTGERFVSDEVNDHFSALCPTIVLDDAERALRLGTRGQRFFAESIAHWYGNSPAPTGYAEEEDHAGALARGREELVARLHEANIPARPVDTGTYNAEHAYGSAGTAIAYVEQLREIGVDEVMCLIQMGTVPQEVCMETIRQWGERVIPHFRALEPAGDRS